MRMQVYENTQYQNIHRYGIRPMHRHECNEPNASSCGRHPGLTPSEAEGPDAPGVAEGKDTDLRRLLLPTLPVCALRSRLVFSSPVSEDCFRTRALSLTAFGGISVG